MDPFESFLAYEKVVSEFKLKTIHAYPVDTG